MTSPLEKDQTAPKCHIWVNIQYSKSDVVPDPWGKEGVHGSFIVRRIQNYGLCAFTLKAT